MTLQDNLWLRWVLVYILGPQLFVSATYLSYGFLLIYLIRKFPDWFAKRAVSSNRSIKMRPKVKDVIMNLVKTTSMINIFVTPLLIWTAPTDKSIYIYNEATWGEVFYKLIACRMLTDTWFYFTHRMFHLPVLYKYIHRVHHEAAEPHALAANYAHPIETLVTNIPTVFGGPVLIKMSPWLLYCWLFYSTIHVVTQHCGYKLLPFVATEHHDKHHAKLKGNYCRSGFWDWVFGTKIKEDVAQNTF
jgi:sterol desaturase/sphingolipid hydroxylase (fatty acid hydroxylase superfamily)